MSKLKDLRPVPRRVSCTYAEAVFLLAPAFNNPINSVEVRGTICAVLTTMYGRKAKIVGEDLERGLP